MPNVFAVPIFFIVFRETLETSVIVSVLLSFLDKQIGSKQDPTVYKKLRNQIWFGTFLGFFICLVIGCAIIGTFYGIGQNKWTPFEYIWEGAWAILASIIIALMGAALLRVSKMQAKWRVKLAKALDPKTKKHSKFGPRFQAWAEKNIMFILPFVTVMREGIEAVVFIGGIILSLPASSIPLATISGLAAGSLIGYIIYKVGNRAPVQIFLIASTCFLYLVAAALFSRGVWYLETDFWNKATGGDASENGAGPGSYDIRRSVWHVNCCSPTYNGGSGWGVFNAILGWQNSATYGSVISYNLFWLVVMLGFWLLRFKETRGHYPFMKAKAVSESSLTSSDSQQTEQGEQPTA